MFYLIIRVIGLTGRSQVVNPDLLEKFKQFSLDTGILLENIVPLPQNGMLNIQEILRTENCLSTLLFLLCTLFLEECPDA